MARVTSAEVATIITTSLDVTPFINTANLLVTRLLSAAGYAEGTLKDIELYLAAHFTALVDQRPVDETVGPASASFVNQFDKYLDFTVYGQTAKMLDTSGTLANIGKKRASFSVISEED